MGCDIHPFLEVRTVLDYTRNDGEIQTLKRAVAAGDADALEQLNSYEVLSPWTFAAGRCYVMSDEEVRRGGPGGEQVSRRGAEGPAPLADLRGPSEARPRLGVSPTRSTLPSDTSTEIATIGCSPGSRARSATAGGLRW